MTAPRQYTDPIDPNTGTADQQGYAAQEFNAGQVDPAGERQVDPATERHGDPTADRQYDPNAGRQVDPSAQQGTSTPAAAQSSVSDTPMSDSLFGENDLSELRSRWNDVQAEFVDDPRACVQKADSLV